MSPGNGNNGFIIQKFPGVPPASQRVPALHHNSQTVHIADNFAFLIIGMDFILDHRRGNGHLGKKSIYLLNIPVRKTDGTDFSICHRLLHGFVRLHITRTRMMEQHQVNILHSQGFQCLVYGLRCIGKLCGIQLCGKKDLFPWHAGLPDSPANCRFIVVHISSIDQPHSAVQC